MEMKFDLEGENNPVTEGLINCVAFWNREGDVLIQNNLNKTHGNVFTHKMVETMPKDDFLLEMVLTDAKDLCARKWAEDHGTWECGRVRSHVWVQHNGVRVMIMHF